MKRLKRDRKGLMLIEGGFVFMKRYNLIDGHYDYNEFIDKIFLSNSFTEFDEEFEEIVKDLRSFRYIKDYKLKNVSIEEYEMCLSEFSENKKNVHFDGSKVHNSILIGDNLTTDKSFHLLVNRNGIRIDKKMSRKEYELINDVLIAACQIPKKK